MQISTPAEKKNEIFLTDCMVFIVENLITGNVLEAAIKQKMFSSVSQEYFSYS